MEGLCHLILKLSKELATFFVPKEDCVYTGAGVLKQQCDTIMN